MKLTRVQHCAFAGMFFAIVPLGAHAAQPLSSQDLLETLSQPVSSAKSAAALFTWKNHDGNDVVGSDAPSLGSSSSVALAYEGTPVGPLGAAFKRLEQANGEMLAAMKRQSARSMAGLPADMQHIADDPRAQAAFHAKMEGMSEEQKMAYAMQMQQQITQGQMQQMQAMAQSAGQPSDADNSAMDKLQDAFTRIGTRRSQVLLRFDRTIGELTELEERWAKGHDAIEAAAQNEDGAIPLERASAIGVGCYSSINARKVRAIALRYADRHIALANQDLGQARQWAAKAHALIVPVAQEDDEIMGDYASIHNAMLKQQADSIVQDVHGATLSRYFQPYADSVRDADLEAARWVHARMLLKKQPLDTCS